MKIFIACSKHFYHEIKMLAGILENWGHEVSYPNSYDDPFMEESCICEINDAIKMSTKRNVDAKLLLPEVEGLLLSGVTRNFYEMSQIDQRLNGKGFPEKVHAHPIENEVQIMKNFIEVRIKSELDMWQPKSKLESWYERNKFIIWAMGTIVALIGLYARFR